MQFGSGDSIEDWRVSLEKTPSTPIPELSTFRSKVLKDLNGSLFSTKGVSVNFLRDFIDGVNGLQLFNSVDLFFLKQDVIGVVNSGTTIKKLAEEDEDGKTLCLIPSHASLSGEDVRLLVDTTDLESKERNDWTFQDVVDFGMRAENIDFGGAFSTGFGEEEKDTGLLGKNFQGSYVIYPKQMPMSKVIDALCEKESTFFWMDIFCVNFDLLEKAREDPDKNMPIATYYTAIKSFVKLFDERIIIFDDWDKPKVLSEGKSVWELSEVVENSLSFDIVAFKIDEFQMIYKRNAKDDLGIFDYMKKIDPSSLFGDHKPDKTFFINSLISHPKGFLSVQQALHNRFTKWFTVELERRVVDFPSRRDHIEMEKFAIFLCKVGSYMRCHGILNVAESYIGRALMNYRQLQNYKASRPRVDPGEQLPELEQIEHDRINGGACRAHVLLAHVKLDLGQPEATAELLRKADHEADKVRTNYHRCVLKIAELRAVMHQKNGDQDKAMDELKTVSLLLRDDRGHEKQNIRASAEMKLAIALRERGQEDEALRCIDRAIELLTPVSSTYPIELADGLIAKGAIFFVRGDVDQSLELFQSALNTLLAQVGSMNVHVAKLYTHLGQVQSKRGKEHYEIAMASYRQSVEVYEAATGPLASGIAFALNYEGLILQNQSKLKDARKTLTQAAAILRQIEEGKLENTSLNDRGGRKFQMLFANVLSNLGQVLIAGGHTVEAKEICNASYERTKQILGEDDITTRRRLERVNNL